MGPGRLSCPASLGSQGVNQMTPVVSANIPVLTQCIIGVWEIVCIFTNLLRGMEGDFFFFFLFHVFIPSLKFF